ncbi:MAG: hypothetical protein HRU10_11480 [Opitutales bacterium]|nr:hypothetical protein [Opitutales bacterium]
MRIAEGAFWAFWSQQAKRAGYPKQRLQHLPSQSDLSELLSGFWLNEQGYSIEAAEILGNRILSPRRQGTAKTCDFRCRRYESMSHILHVEVKCSERSAHDSLGEFAHQGVQKGARWLIIFQLPIVSLNGTLASEELITDTQQKILGQRPYLNMRRAGLTRITQLFFTPDGRL